MSDFIFSTKKFKHGELSKEIKKIYREDPPEIQEYHGKWGSLAVSKNLYNGFQTYENDKHIFILLGGPVLFFKFYNLINSNQENIKSMVVYNRWVEGKIKWEHDLNGPFAILIINKSTFEIQCVTDLMSFIPIYKYQDKEKIMLSTHIDILANASNQSDKLDIVSYVDFILHNAVTFPYTVYKDIYQIKPASVYHFKRGLDKILVESKNYWVPQENYIYDSIDQAAEEIRSSLVNYVNEITSESTNVAQFISGGEDSRALSGLLKGKSKDAFIFLDGMNREGKVAKKAAEAYGINFNLATRTKTHYLNILPGCSDLVGSGSQYHHAHTYGFHKRCNLQKYDAVFGGLMSDALLKGYRIKKNWVSARFQFIPDIKDNVYSHSNPIKNYLIKDSILKELTKRRNAHLDYIKTFRTESAEEWFELWPISMNMSIANLHANRRLFRSYEPFLSNEIVKISASVPQNWKLNRKLFYKAVKPLLKPTKWLLHGDGRLPYFPWYINSFVQFFWWFSRQVSRRLGLIKGNQGPWAKWSEVLKSEEWKRAIVKYSDGFSEIEEGFNESDIKQILGNSNLSVMQQINLLQVLYENKSRK